MILLPDTSRLVLPNEDNEQDFNSLLDQMNSLKSVCDSFLDSTACVWRLSKSIHVVQGEFAQLSLTETNLTCFGSTDATTCAITIAVDLPTLRATVCHHDEATVLVPQNITQLVCGMESPQLYLVGSYAGGNPGVSFSTVSTLLKILDALPTPITLRLFCALDWNTDPSGAPRCQSLAISLPSIAPFPVAPFNEGGWVDRGPLISARMGQLWYNAYGKKVLRSVYDSSRGIFISRLVTGQVAVQTREALSKILSLPDDKLLMYLSTSPEHELPHVASDLRESCRWVVEQDERLRVEERQFKWVYKQGWIELGIEIESADNVKHVNWEDL